MQHHTKHRRHTRHMYAYKLGLRERLEETNHLILTSITQAPNETDHTKKLTPIIRRAKRIQALLDATHAQ